VTTQINSLVSDSFKENQDTIRQSSGNIWIVSGGFKEIIAPIVANYGIGEDHILANQFLFKGDRVTGCDKNKPLFQNQGKIKAIDSVYTQRERVMVGDGHTDLEVYLEGSAQHFIYYAENVSRKKVIAQSRHIASSFNQILEILKTL
jgi:D-3-phosphoglycerate dehydrogenase